MAFRHTILFAALLSIAFSSQNLHAQGNPVFSNYEYYVTEDATIGLYKPKGWKVGTQRYPNGRMVFVTDPKDLSYANMIFLENIDPNHDSVIFAGATLKNVSKQMPNLKILEARTSRDRMHTVVKYQRSGPENILIEGKYCFNVKRPNAVVFGYEAPANHFQEMVPTLLTIITNITLLDDKAYQKLSSQRKDNKSVVLPMKQVSAPDGTCWLMVPQGWKLRPARAQHSAPLLTGIRALSLPLSILSGNRGYLILTVPACLETFVIIICRLPMPSLWP